MTANMTPPAVKSKAATKAPKEAKEKANRSSFAKLYPEDAPLKVLAEKNPKRAGSKAAKRFDGYFKAKTVGDALANGVTYADIAYDVGHQFIKIG